MLSRRHRQLKWEQYDCAKDEMPRNRVKCLSKKSVHSTKQGCA